MIFCLIMLLRNKTNIYIVMRICPVAPLVMGYLSEVLGAMPLLSLHLACMFEWGLESGEGYLNQLDINERGH